MKLLIFEYFTGGGMCREFLPNEFATEGLLMLRALLRDISELDTVETLLLLDERLVSRIGVLPNHVTTILMGPSSNFKTELTQRLSECDAVWPIAPETDDVFSELTRLIESLGKTLLSSPWTAVSLTTDKLRTIELLAFNGIAAVPSTLLGKSVVFAAGGLVVKPIDGAGCERTYFFDNEEAAAEFGAGPAGSGGYVVQPYIEGRPMSLSCLFKNGKAWMLSVNEQLVRIVDNTFELTGCRVNVAGDVSVYQAIIGRIALAIPTLWGYAGVDFIESQRGIEVLEINPRLTSSYAGIHDALGINVVQQVLALLENKGPDLTPSRNDTVEVAIAEETIHDV